MRRLVILVLVMAVTAQLSACGRKGRLIPPEDATYPRTYPDFTFPQTQTTGAQTRPETETR